MVDIFARSQRNDRTSEKALNVERAAEILGVTCNDILLFDETGNPLAERYLLLWDNKHINHDGWNGWTFSQGCLLLLKTRENAETIEKLDTELRKLESWPGLILVRRKRRYRHINFNVI